MRMQCTSIDPLCEKYYAMSPYAYCAGNPVMLIDPSGKWIQVWEGDQSYTKDGQLYQSVPQTDEKGVTQYKDEVYKPKHGSVLEGVCNALNDIEKSGKTGQDLLKFYANDKNTADIFATSPMDKYGNHTEVNENTGDPIKMKSDLSGSEMLTTKGVQKSPFFIDLAHELSHRQDFILHPNQREHD